MALDGLAGKLELLLSRGALAASRFTGRDRHRLQGLFDSGVLAEERSGAGKRVRVRNPVALATFVAQTYPSGLQGRPGELPPRSRAVAEVRDAKKARPGSGITLLVRGFAGCEFRAGETVLPVASWTGLAGVAALCLDRQWSFRGLLAVVENLEVFHHFERIGTKAQLAIYSGGRLPKRVLDWLASPAMARARILHCGDYDPVGLDEYLRLKKACPDRTELHLPPDLEGLLSRYGKKELLSANTTLLDRLRKSDDPEIRRVVTLLDRHGVGLEQEALLLGDVSPTENIP